MKKLLIKIVPLMVAMLLVVAIITSVNAATANVSLTASKSELKPGDTFTVVYKVGCEDGINGVTGKLSYDTDKLELSGSPVVASGFYRMAENDQSVFSIVNDGSTEKSVNMITLTFKVKSGATGTAKITMSDLTVDPDTDDTINVGTKECTVTIDNGGSQTKTLSSIKVATPPTKTSYKEGDKFDKTGMKVLAVYSDGTTKEVTGYSYSPSGKLTASNKKITISYTEDGVTKTAEQPITVTASGSGNNVNVSGDNTISGKGALPKTGAEIVIVPMVIVAIVGAGAYLRYKNTEI